MSLEPWPLSLEGGREPRMSVSPTRGPREPLPLSLGSAPWPMLSCWGGGGHGKSWDPVPPLGRVRGSQAARSPGREAGQLCLLSWLGTEGVL